MEWAECDADGDTDGEWELQREQERELEWERNGQCERESEWVVDGDANTNSELVTNCVRQRKCDPHGAADSVGVSESDAEPDAKRAECDADCNPVEELDPFVVSLAHLRLSV